MVATLLRLRFRVLANTLRRNTIQLVAVILGGVQAVLAILIAVAGLVVSAAAPPDAIEAIVVLGGSALVLGWIVVPLLFEGIEQTLDPVKLARYPLRTGELMTAMLVVGVAWMPGVATIVISLATALAWRHHPEAVVPALASGLLGALTCIVLSRLIAATVGTLLRGRGAARMGVGGLALLAIGGPIVASIAAGAAAGAGDPGTMFAQGVAVLGWTPLGAAWSVPGRIAMGDAAGAALAAGIAVATLAVVVACWWRALAKSLRSRGSGRTAASHGSGLGPFGWVPQNPGGAIAARALVYWFRDARHAKQLVIIPVLPALLLLWWWLIDVEAIGLSAGPLVAALLPLSVFAGLSYDGTAFAAELAAGVRGVHDRAGRAFALLVIAVPAVVVVQVVVAVVMGRQGDLAALLGLSLGTLLVATGVVSVSSARLVVPVAESGRNPFSAPAGAATTAILASYAVMAATIAVSSPVIAATVFALVVGDPLGGVVLVFGIAWGGAVAFGGVLLGGRWFDESGPAVLARLRRVRV